MGTFATSGAIVDKAGSNVSTLIPEAAFDAWISEAEATVSGISRYDYVTASAAIISTKIPLIQGTVSALAAIQAVKYNMSGYTSRIEAEDVINVLRDEALRGLNILRDQKGVTFTKR